MVESSGQINDHAGFIWSVADLLRGDYKQSEYGPEATNQAIRSPRPPEGLV